MKKSVLWILVACLLIGFVFHVFFNKPTRENGQGKRDDIMVNGKPEPTLEEDSILADDLDSVDIEIERHGYDPSTKQERDTLRKSYLIARDGADAMLTFHVTDSKGRDVPQASFHAGFIVSDKVFTVRDGETDENGMFIAKGKTAYDVNYVITKEGYYQTSSTLYFAQRLGNDVKGGKWTPWNPTVNITLKEKRNPIPMYRKGRCIVYVPKGETVGFDCMFGDLVAPHGKGVTADLLFTYTATRSGETLNFVTNKLVFTSQDIRGLCVRKKDEHSGFAFEYEASLEGYQDGIVFELERTSDKITKNTELSNDNYIVFRSRAEKDTDNNITRINYGIIDILKYGETFEEPNKGAIVFGYYFNPTPNDRNLEYDPEQNLFDKKKFRGMQP